MASGASPEDLRTILSRFHTWAEKQPANGSGNGHRNGTPDEEVREIPYEEAIRLHRSREAARTQRRANPPKSSVSASSRLAVKASPQPQPTTSVEAAPELENASEDLPSWATNLPVVPETEPVIELKAATPSPGPTAAARPAASLPNNPASAPHPRKPSPRPRAVAAKAPHPVDDKAAARQALLAALAELQDLPAQTFVDIPPAALAPRHRPQRKVSPPPVQEQTVPAVVDAPAASKPVTAVAASASAQPAPPPVERSKPSAAPKSAPTVKAAKPAPPAIAAKPEPPAAATKPVTPSAAPKRPPRPRRLPVAVAAYRKSTAALAQSSIIGSPIRTAQPLPRKARRSALASGAKSKSRPAKRPHFRQVLAGTVELPKSLIKPANKPAPDRTRRITTRFSPTEERRIEKRAAELGITVSAYLRQCALATVAQSSTRDALEPLPMEAPRKPVRQSASAPLHDPAAAPSLFGGWLSLLRNRFLGPPIRFTDEA